MAHGDIWKCYEGIFNRDPLLLDDESQELYGDSLLRHLLLNRTMNAFSPVLVDIHKQWDRDKFSWRDPGTEPRPPIDIVRRYRSKRIDRSELDTSDRSALEAVTMVSRGKYTINRTTIHPTHDEAITKLSAAKSKIDTRLRIAAIGYRLQVSKVANCSFLDEELRPAAASSATAAGHTKPTSRKISQAWEKAILSHVDTAHRRHCHFILLPEFALPGNGGKRAPIEEKIYRRSKRSKVPDHFMFAGSRHERNGNLGLVIAKQGLKTSKPWWHGKVASARGLGENILGPHGTRRPSYAALFQIAEGEKPNFPIDIAICYDSFDPTTFLALILQSLVSTDDEIRPRMMLVPSFNTSLDFVALLRDLSFLSRSMVVYVNGLHGDAKMYICGFAVSDFTDLNRVAAMRAQLQAKANQFRRERQRKLETLPVSTETSSVTNVLFKKMKALETLDQRIRDLEDRNALDCVITVEDKPNKNAIVGRYDPSDLLYYNIDMGLLDALCTFRSEYFGLDSFLPQPFQYESLKKVALEMRDKIREQERIRTERYKTYMRAKKAVTGPMRHKRVVTA